jgi:hypothetical protein
VSTDEPVCETRGAHFLRRMHRLDVIVGERHLQRVLEDYSEHYNTG